MPRHPAGAVHLQFAFEEQSFCGICARQELAFACFGLEMCTARLERKRQHVGVHKSRIMKIHSYVRASHYLLCQEVYLEAAVEENQRGEDSACATNKHNYA